MSRIQTSRRLAAILAADVVGYSRMMASDEVGTLTALKRHRELVFNPAVAQHNGRVIKLIGDGTLVEFGSVVDAVNCAIAVQTAVPSDATSVGKIVLRVGVNLGDVIIDGDDIYGVGVNVAARLEALAAPGGICISGIVNENVENRIDVVFEDGGDVTVKNIDRPIRVWKWPSTALVKPLSATPDNAPRTVLRDMLPSLAVLPFQNMSGDPEQNYFADGIVQDLITALSRFRSFAVTARNSSFVYKGRATDIRQVARELGVRYVLEGSVRFSGSRLRVTVELVEGTTGTHLWATKFDADIVGIFDIQDRITESVVAIVQPRIQRAELDYSRSTRPESVDAYDLYLQALQKLNTESGDENEVGIALLERAIELEPDYATALALAAASYQHPVAMGLPTLSADDAERSLELARRALASAPDDPIVLAECGMVRHSTGRDYDQGLLMLLRALETNPHDATIVWRAGIAHLKGGSLDEAQALFERAVRLSPGDAFIGLTGIAHIHMARGNFEEALDFARRSLAHNSRFPATHWMLIAGNAHLGRLDDARRALEALQKLSPDVSLAGIRRGQHSKDPHRTQVLIDGMRLAGMPEV
ncbi:adenylate/guanylate cyclase domain-containing protein [Rhizobium sp. LjRoot254]|uniref:adenylate/guanylate cyclase domain-containing protein n=1 Tax=Rhizobium sp. LjRoot254 TaxID=3342297 RepID=UPI003F4FBAE7